EFYTRSYSIAHSNRASCARIAHALIRPTFRVDLSPIARLLGQKSHHITLSTPATNRIRVRLDHLEFLPAWTPHANVQSTYPAGIQKRPAAIAQTPLIAWGSS